MTLFKKYDIMKNGMVYMRRFFLFRSRWGNLYLHHIRMTDKDRDPHDHPGWFVSWVLKGWYVEEVWNWVNTVKKSHIWSKKVLRRGRFNVGFRKQSHVHKITRLSPGGVWTFVLTGPWGESWGFTKGVGRTFRKGYAATKWVYWREYLNQWDTAKEIQ